jgi:hypothetical protein
MNEKKVEVDNVLIFFLNLFTLAEIYAYTQVFLHYIGFIYTTRLKTIITCI